MSSTYVLYSQINGMEEFGFIAGQPYTIFFEVFEEDNVTPLDMGGATFKWVLSPYGQSYNIKEITGEVTGIGTAKVELSTADTIGLSGKYIQQPIVISFTGEEYRPSQGIVLIQEAIPLN